MAETRKDFFKYKRKPLVRCGDEIYYGSITDKYVIHIQIKSKRTKGNLEVADKVVVVLMNTDRNMAPREATIKTSEKPTLYDALDIGDVWLRKALREYSQK